MSQCTQDGTKSPAHERLNLGQATSRRKQQERWREKGGRAPHLLGVGGVIAADAPDVCDWLECRAPRLDHLCLRHRHRTCRGEQPAGHRAQRRGHRLADGEIVPGASAISLS
eukprot:scaffold260115_cov31-Tisochrysis_lutea.AAC.1